MKRIDDPNIVSLESVRRRKQAEDRKRKAQAASHRAASGEKAINWRRVPLALAIIAAFLAASWVISHIAALLPK